MTPDQIRSLSAMPPANPREPLINYARSAFQSEKPQIVWREPSDSSHRYGRGERRARCGFSGETLPGRAFAGAPPRFGSLIWNDQTTLAEAAPVHPAKTPSRPCIIDQRFPSYPRGPYRFVDREYLIIMYRSDPDAIRAMVPEPLEPDGSNQVFYEWINMPDSSGFGSYQETGVVIPCRFEGEPVNYTAMMFLNDEPPISAGREIWGFPKRWGEPRLEVRTDTLTGTLHYAGERVAMGTMTYKYHDRMAPDPNDRGAHLRKTSVNLKVIPCVTGAQRVAELVAYNLTDIRMHFHYSGPARLHLIPHINAPVADLPVREIIEGRHFKADLTLPYGRVLHDYLA